MKMIFFDYQSERNIDHAVVFVADNFDPYGEEGKELLAEVSGSVDDPYIAAVVELDVVSGSLDNIRDLLPYIA